MQDLDPRNTLQKELLSQGHKAPKGQQQPETPFPTHNTM